MIGVDVGVALHALGTEELEASSLCAEVGDGFLAVFVAGDVVVEVGLHVLNRKGLLHANRFKYSYMLRWDDG